MIKNKKFLELFCFALIIVVFIIFGYCTYKSYSLKKGNNNKNVEINNFYNIDYLFNNNYLSIAKTISDFSSKDKDLYMYLDADNVLYIKFVSDKIDNDKSIEGLPKEKVNVYYNKIDDNNYEFIARTNSSDIYYVSILLDSNDKYSFKKVGESIKEVYVPTYDKQYVYVNINKKFYTNFVFVDNKKNIKYLDYQDGKYSIKDDFSKKKPYFNYVCADDLSIFCNDFMIYQAFNNEVIYNGRPLSFDNKKIYAKEMFSSFEVDNVSEVDFSSLNSNNFTKYKYLFTTYVVNEAGLLYKIDINNDAGDISVDCINRNSDKVKEIEYGYSKIEIIFNNGDKEIISKEKNKILITSTIYDRSQKNK